MMVHSVINYSGHQIIRFMSVCIINVFCIQIMKIRLKFHVRYTHTYVSFTLIELSGLQSTHTDLEGLADHRDRGLC